MGSDSRIPIITSSGSVSLNSHPSPVHVMICWHVRSVNISSKNCHSWIGPLPWYPAKSVAGIIGWVPSPIPWKWMQMKVDKPIWVFFYIHDFLQFNSTNFVYNLGKNQCCLKKFQILIFPPKVRKWVNILHLDLNEILDKSYY